MTQIITTNDMTMIEFHAKTDKSLDFKKLKQLIKEREEQGFARLKSLKAETKNDDAFNYHIYIMSFEDIPFSTLFIIADEGKPEDDPEVKKWLAEHEGEKVWCAHKVYIENSLKRIAVVR